MVICLPFGAVCQTVTRNPTLTGLVLNPFGENVILRRDLLVGILGRKRPHTEQKEQKQNDLRQTDAQRADRLRPPQETIRMVQGLSHSQGLDLSCRIRSSIAWGSSYPFSSALRQ